MLHVRSPAIGAAHRETCPDPEVCAFRVDDELILFSGRSRQIVRGNATAAFVWDLCLDELSLEEMAAQYAEAFRVSPQVAARDVEVVLSFWREHGLLGSGTGSCDEAPADEDEESPPLPLSRHEAERLRFRLFFEGYFTLFDATIRLRSYVEQSQILLDPVLGHLCGAAIYRSAEALDLVPYRGGFALLSGDAVINSCPAETGIAPMVHGQLLMTAMESAEYAFAFHAAVMGRDDRWIMLPAVSGAGKSTLAAALMCAGYRYYTDELVAVSPSGRILTAPLSIGLKQGSWETIARVDGRVEQLTRHLRFDGKWIRYLPPAPDRLPPSPPRGIPDAIVFPAYDAAAPPATRALGTGEALAAITEAGYDMAEDFTQVTVARLIQWLGHIRAYGISYGDTEQAVSLIDAILD